MGLFGPSQREITNAVADGIHQAIRTSRSTEYHIKKGEKRVPGAYLVLPPELEVSLVPYDGSDSTPTPPPRKVRVDGSYIIYEVIEIKKTHRFNPFTDKTTETITSERNMGRYYSYDGWDNSKIQRLVRYARMNGYYPSDDTLVKMIIEDSDGR